MMKLAAENVRVAAVTAAIPSQALNLGELFGEQDAKRISLSTGIRSVRVAGSLTTADLCERAAAHLLTTLDVDPRSVDGLVLVTQTPDDLMPGAAFEVHRRLGLSHDCVAFDVNHGCSGFIYGLLQASGLIAAGCRRVLLCTGDTISKVLDPQDRKVRMVFGDAGSACLVEPGHQRIDFAFWSAGTGNTFLRTPTHYHPTNGRRGPLHMDGNEVMRFALANVPPVINALLEETGTRREDVRLFALHQANRFMLSYLIKLLGVDEEVVPSFLEDVGNTGPSSIPLLLAAIGGGIDRVLSPTLLCGFGVGLSIGASLLDLSQTRFISPININADDHAQMLLLDAS